MKKRELKQYEVILDPKETKLIKLCLDYCWHRLTNHKKSGITNLVDEGLLDYLRQQLSE